MCYSTIEIGQETEIREGVYHLISKREQNDKKEGRKEYAVLEPHVVRQSDPTVEGPAASIVNRCSH